MDLTKKVNVHYDTLIHNGEQPEYRLDLRGTDVPREITKTDCEQIAETLKREQESKWYPVGIYQVDRDGDIIYSRIDSTPTAEGIKTTTGWYKIGPQGQRTSIPIVGERKTCAVAGMVTTQLGVAKRAIELFEEKGYEVLKMFE